MPSTDMTTKTGDFDTLGGRLSRARASQNSSLSDIAELVGVEEQTLEAWEHDRATPRLTASQCLLAFLAQAHHGCYSDEAHHRSLKRLNLPHHT